MKEINGLLGMVKVVKASEVKPFQLSLISGGIVAITTNPDKPSKFFKVNIEERKAIESIINELGEITLCQNSQKHN